MFCHLNSLGNNHDQVVKSKEVIVEQEKIKLKKFQRSLWQTKCTDKMETLKSYKNQQL